MEGEFEPEIPELPIPSLGNLDSFDFLLCMCSETSGIIEVDNSRSNHGKECYASHIVKNVL